MKRNPAAFTLKFLLILSRTRLFRRSVRWPCGWRFEAERDFEEERQKIQLPKASRVQNCTAPRYTAKQLWRKYHWKDRWCYSEFGWRATIFSERLFISRSARRLRPPSTLQLISSLFCHLPRIRRFR
jgi:hypothetical protein